MFDDQPFVKIPIPFMTRAAPFSDYSIFDICIVTFTLCNKIQYTQTSLTNIKYLLLWLGLKDYHLNCAKVRRILLAAQDRYLDVRRAYDNEPINESLGFETLIKLELKPDIAIEFELAQFKRVPISNIRAIVDNENYTPSDLCCYYLLLSSAMCYDDCKNIYNEYAHLWSCSYSVHRMGDALELNYDTVKKSITRLESKGLIIPQKRTILKSNEGYFSKPTPYQFAVI